MTAILWVIITVIFLFWLLGQLVHFGGDVIHFLLILVVFGIIYQLVTTRRV